jgi:hypothetical protein
MTTPAHATYGQPGHDSICENRLGGAYYHAGPPRPCRCPARAAADLARAQAAGSGTAGWPAPGGMPAYDDSQPQVCCANGTGMVHNVALSGIPSLEAEIGACVPVPCPEHDQPGHMFAENSVIDLRLPEDD